MNKAVPTVLAVGGPDSPELSHGDGGMAPLVHVGRVLGYRVGAYRVDDLAEFRRTMQFLGKVALLPECQRAPLLVHISVGGDPNGVTIGPDRMTWEQWARMVLDLSRDLEPCSGPVILTLWARGADERNLARMLRNHGNVPSPRPEHVFLFAHGLPSWIDAMLAWTHFYSEATEIDFTADAAQELPKVRRLQVRTLHLGLGQFRYFGWPASAGGCESPL